MNVAKAADDLDALRHVIEAVKDFKQDDQRRIFRWAAEKLALPVPFAAAPEAGVPPAAAASLATPATPPTGLPARAHSGPQDIKSFVAAKNPRSDVQFAATVAYFYQFLAPEAERKSSITKEDLEDAGRKVRRKLKKPGQTLINAHSLGLLDKGAERGTYLVNSVGENLVAMTLPGHDEAGAPPAKKRPKRNHKAAAKKTNGTKASVKRAKKA